MSSGNSTRQITLMAALAGRWWTALFGELVGTGLVAALIAYPVAVPVLLRVPALAGRAAAQLRRGA